VRRLAGGNPETVLDDGVRLPLPLSPHLAARLNGSEINLDALMAIIDAQPANCGWIVEGAGGVMVPLDGSNLMVDFMDRLGLPIVIVSRTALGTINHTLLTLEALRRRSLRVVGVLMVGDANPENRLAIERYGEVGVLGELPTIDPLTPAGLGTAAASLDPENRLLECLR
jgi:dethiobiotin synthetase